MSLHFPILIGLSKCTPGLSIPARVPDKNDLSRAFAGTLCRSPQRACPASCQQQSVMESSRCFWFSMRSREMRAFLHQSYPSWSSFSIFFVLSSHTVCNKQVNISMRAHPPLWTYTDTQAPGHMHKFTCFPHADASPQPHIHTQALAEGQHSEANLICVFMCPVSHCPCLFLTSCHHVPSPSLLVLGPGVICRQSWEKFRARNLPLVFGLLSRSLMLTRCLIF